MDPNTCYLMFPYFICYRLLSLSYGELLTSYRTVSNGSVVSGNKNLRFVER